MVLHRCDIYHSIDTVMFTSIFAKKRLHSYARMSSIDLIGYLSRCHSNTSQKKKNLSWPPQNIPLQCNLSFSLLYYSYRIKTVVAVL